ncbi:MAG: HD domain-containing protein [Leptospiraceae bacterium]|nr:HD domain-containing protein [Leptospiraceae bacterium]MDW8307421.1 HD domain-containing protein [Leptospiraceae bacterium]
MPQKPPLKKEELPYIRDLETGFLEEGYFLLYRLNLVKSRQDKPYLRLILSDKSGLMPAVFFGSQREIEHTYKKLRKGQVVKIQGIIEEFAQTLQIKLYKIEPASPPHGELSRFFKRTPHDRRKLHRRMRDLLNSLERESLKNLCLSFLNNREFLRLFLEAPASRVVHHAYVGGLLEHTLHVMELCDSYSRIFPWAERDLLISGAFLHDIGKVDEYEYLFQAIEHTSKGKLKGHTLLGYERLQAMLQHYPLEEPLRLKVEHILLAHQGRRIWGAVEEPRFLEAYLVHAADATDASQFIYSEPRREKRQDREWSDYISYLGRDIYLG